MDEKFVLSILASVILPFAQLAHAQQPAKVPRIGPDNGIAAPKRQRVTFLIELISPSKQSCQIYPISSIPRQ
jgi:hypothetical protein